MNTTVLSTHKLTVGYGRHILFQDLDLKLEKGKLVCFMGPNGVGKSSLIRTLAGLQKSSSGEVTLFSKDEIHRQLAVVLTDRVVGSNMKVGELISIGRYPHLNWTAQLTDADKAAVTDAINKVHLSALLDKDINELSDGQLQMAMIARALAQDTPVILMDEPTAHLDLNNRLEIMKVLLQLTRTMNKAILVSTHELDLALQTADEIWLAGNNKSILRGIPEDLVLNGAFDDVFRFKGFDLRTGKVQHEVRHSIDIELIGQGHELLWTKNALERNGYAVRNDQSSHRIVIKVSEGRTQWHVDDLVTFSSIKEVLEHFAPAVSH
ncbi:MAG TPA: ABC transporter ATP-binding protein [Chryseolinea sp.]|nr:ABC transporter ATP-binding protein [Chryseolinea sp.]